MEKQVSDLTKEISKGLDLAFAKLVKEKAQVNGELIFTDDNGKIYKVKAKDLLNRI